MLYLYVEREGVCRFRNRWDKGPLGRRMARGFSFYGGGYICMYVYTDTWLNESYISYLSYFCNMILSSATS